LHATFNPEGCVDDLPSALGVDHAVLAVRFERGFGAGFVLGRERRRFFLDRLDDIAPRGQLRSSGGTS